jgi:uncharacterized membrane protein
MACAGGLALACAGGLALACAIGALDILFTSVVFIFYLWRRTFEKEKIKKF